MHIPIAHGFAGRPEYHAVSDPFALDLQVLQHLRGYPDDLHRYANLMKQAHPRGMSAVEFLLSRPASADGFLEALCRLVRDGEPILTAVEAAGQAAVPPAQFLGDVAARPDFPAPLFRREHRAIWRKTDIEAYLAAGSTRSAQSQARDQDV